MVRQTPADRRDLRCHPRGSSLAPPLTHLPSSGMMERWLMTSSGSARRNAKLASIPVGIAGRAALGATKRLTGKSRTKSTPSSWRRPPTSCSACSASLKGGAMNRGPGALRLEAAIPEEKFSEPYRRGPDQTAEGRPANVGGQGARVLDGQLGTKWRDQFPVLRRRPVASASIGQVHKGVWRDGREVAVKISTPAPTRLRADLKTMRRLTSVLKQLAPALTCRASSTNSSNAPKWNWTTGWKPTTSGHSRKPMRDIRISRSRTSSAARRRWWSASGSRASRWPRSSVAAPARSATSPAQGFFELTFDAPARVGMMHGDAHPWELHAARRRPHGRHRLRRGGTAAQRPAEEMGIMIPARHAPRVRPAAADHGEGGLHPQR